MPFTNSIEIRLLILVTLDYTLIITVIHIIVFSATIKEDLEYDMSGTNELQLAVYLFQEAVSEIFICFISIYNIALFCKFL